MLFTVKLPILGFETLQHLHLEKVDDIFMHLQADNDEKSPTFTLINPYILRDYTFDIPTAIEKLLEIEENSNLLIFNIIILDSTIEESKINFLAPLVFNTDNQSMAQVILENRQEYSIAEPIKNYLHRHEQN